MAETKKVKTSSGLDENIAGLLCYLAGWITGLIFLLTEKENKFVRFHAIQSIALSIVLVGVFIILAILNSILFSILPFTMWGIIPVISAIVWIGALALWIILMVMAYQKKKFKLPLIGDFCEKKA